MKRRIVACVSILLFVLLLSNRAEACTCGKSSPCEAFGYSSVVFVGRMLGGAEKVRVYTEAGETLSVEGGVSRFAVEISYKGVRASDVEIFVANGSCEGIKGLVRGETYLVYATYKESKGMPFVGPCSRTRAVNDAADDFAFLKHLPVEGTGGRIYGEVLVETGAEPKPLPDLSIVIEDESHKEHQVKTNKNGEYEVAGLPAGKYMLKPVLPEGYVTYEYFENRVVEVGDRGCLQVPFSLRINGKVSGRVRDAAGRPSPVDLILESADDIERHFLGHADEDGNYEIEGVPPGTYVLKIDLEQNRDKKDYFYPDTVDRSHAASINLTFGQQITVQDWHLPLQIFLVQGTVAYSDGKPASNVEVKLVADQSVHTTGYQVEGLTTETETDDYGRFTVRGYKGVAYNLLAGDNSSRTIEENREVGKMETDRIYLDKDIDGLKLILPLTTRPSAEKRRHRSRL